MRATTAAQPLHGNSGRHPVVPAGSIVFLPQGVKVTDSHGRVRRIQNEYSFVLGTGSGAWSEWIFWGGVRGMRNRVKKSDCRIFLTVTPVPADDGKADRYRMGPYEYK